MNENVCICSFVPEDLFEDETHNIGFVDIKFFKSNTMPDKSIKYELAVLVCDFDSDSSVDRFLDCIENLNCEHLHLFCIGEQWLVRNVIRELPTLEKIDSFSVIIKDNSYNSSLVEGMVYNFITPLCSTMIQPTAMAYDELNGPLEIIAVENLPEEDVKNFVTSLLKKEKSIIFSVIGEGYSLITIEDVRNALPDCEMWCSIDTEQPYNMILIIRQLDEYYMPKKKRKKRKSESTKAKEESSDYDLKKELEAKFDELFGTIDESNG